VLLAKCNLDVEQGGHETVDCSGYCISIGLAKSSRDCSKGRQVFPSASDEIQGLRENIRVRIMIEKVIIAECIQRQFRVAIDHCLESKLVGFLSSGNSFRSIPCWPGEIRWRMLDTFSQFGNSA
jgi:hypothetical protein